MNETLCSNTYLNGSLDFFCIIMVLLRHTYSQKRNLIYSIFKHRIIEYPLSFGYELDWMYLARKWVKSSFSLFLVCSHFSEKEKRKQSERSCKTVFNGHSLKSGPETWDPRTLGAGALRHGTLEQELWDMGP